MKHIFDNYRQYPAISNSDLTEFKNKLFGITPFKPVKAFAFGAAVHEAILEPHKPHIYVDSVDYEQVHAIAKRVKANKFCQWILQFSQKEVGYLFDDADTGLPCKAQIDMVWRKNLIVDFKTTSQRNYDSFVKSCYDYEYDRQAAFYLNAASPKANFVFVGIQKKAPFDIFFFEAKKQQGFLEYGRKKYQALLATWKEQGGATSFIPSTWNAELLKQVA